MVALNITEETGMMALVCIVDPRVGAVRGIGCSPVHDAGLQAALGQLSDSVRNALDAVAFATLGGSTNIASVHAVFVTAILAGRLGTSNATIVGREDDRRQLVGAVVSAKEGMAMFGKKVLARHPARAPARTKTGDAAAQNEDKRRETKDRAEFH